MYNAFECTMCGKCCKAFDDENAVLLFARDVVRLAQALDIETDEFLRIYTTHRNTKLCEEIVDLYFLKNSDGVCVFFDEEKQCTIHDIKPVQCQRTPFNFFWQAVRQSDFECIREVNVPSDWTSDELDRELTSELFISRIGGNNGST